MEELDFTKSRIVLCIAKCGAGKTNAVKQIILKNSLPPKNIFQFGIVFTRTKYSDDYTYIDDRFVIQGYQEDILRKWMKNLEKIKSEKKKDMPHNWIIFDDLIGLLSTRDPFLINLFATHRHQNTTCFILGQSLKQSATVVLREVVSYGILFNSKRFDTMDAFWREFAMEFETFKDFKKHFFKVTKKKYHALLYDSSQEDPKKNFLQIKFPLMSDVNIQLTF